MAAHSSSSPTHKLQKLKLAEVVRRQMEADLTTGKWVNLLPGVKRLMEHYSVSEPSVVQAMAMLEKAGYLEKAEVGKRRKISQRKLELTRKIIIVRPRFHLTHEDSNKNYQLLINNLKTQDIDYYEVVRISGEDANLINGLKRRKLEGQILGVILFNQFEGVADIVASLGDETPVLCWAGEGLRKHPLVSVMGADYGRVFSQMVRFLVNRKVLRFSFITLDLPNAVVSYFRESVRKSMKEEGIEFDPAMHFPDLNRADIGSKLSKIVIQHKPTLFITCYVETYVRVLTELQQLSCPQPVMNLFDDPIFSQFDQSPAIGEINPKLLVNRAIKWIRSVQECSDPRDCTFEYSVPAKLRWS